MCKFRELKPSEIDVRVDQCFKTEKWQGVRLLLYKDARVDMNILDETVGSLNWQRSHEVVNGNLYCKVSIYDKDKGEWISKSDCGVESNTEKEKGQSSDSFKRACVCWGIGRELYSAPKNILAKCDVDEYNDGGKRKLRVKDKYLKWVVTEIGYNKDREVNRLVICESRNGVVGEAVFFLSEKNISDSRTESPKKRADSKPTSKKASDFGNPPTDEELPFSDVKKHDVEWASKVTFALTNGKKMLVSELDDLALDRLIESSNADLAEAREAGRILRFFKKKKTDGVLPPDGASSYHDEMMNPNEWLNG